MNQELIELTITVDARYQGERIAGPCLVSQQVILQFPYQIDPKFINLAKVMEGLIPSVVEAHKNKVMADYTQKKERGQLAIWGLNGKTEVSVTYGNLPSNTQAQAVDPETGEISPEEAGEGESSEVIDTPFEDAPLTQTEDVLNETEAVLDELADVTASEMVEA